MLVLSQLGAAIALLAGLSGAVLACGSTVSGGGGGGAGGMTSGTATTGSGTAAAECESLCAESNMCAGATMTDCAVSCAEVTTLNAAAGCGAKYQAVLSCAGGLSDLCSALSTACSTQIAGYTSCVEAYCTQTPTPSACAAG
jgi:hypothetical protein